MDVLELNESQFGMEKRCEGSGKLSLVTATKGNGWSQDMKQNPPSSQLFTGGRFTYVYLDFFSQVLPSIVSLITTKP
jgi:hypothetical protein